MCFWNPDQERAAWRVFSASGHTCCLLDSVVGINACGGWCTYSLSFIKICKIKWRLWTSLKKDFFFSSVSVLVSSICVCVFVGGTCVCVCLWVVHAWLCLWVVHADECRCPHRPAEGIEFHGTGVTGYELPAWMLWTRLLTSTRIVCSPNHQATSRGPFGTFWWKTNIPEMLFSD